MEWIRFWLDVRSFVEAAFEAVAFMGATLPGLVMLLVTTALIGTCVTCEVRQRRRA